ncbi:MAG: sugar kinase [Bacteroidia bacterium]|nr:sugar kinase [Bacteroidia bacterium]
MGKIVTFGEVMGRVEAENFFKFRQILPGQVRITFSGAEANVAVSLACMKKKTQFVTALPSNAIGEACLGFLRGMDVGVEHIQLSNKGRLGLYFLETGANQRPSSVVYDREGSSVSLVEANSYNWDEIFSGARWFHLSGITPAISKTAADAALMSVKKAKEHNVTVSYDLNYRNKLWLWDSNYTQKDLAQKVSREILKYVDILYGNEEDASDVLGIHPPNVDVHSGSLDVNAYEYVGKEIYRQFPNLEYVAFTLRESISASHNNWGSLLYDPKTNKTYLSPVVDESFAPYEIKNIVDRVGGGDSFGAGLIYAFTDEELSQSLQSVLDYATAASCLCHSIQGDINFSSKEDVLRLMRGNASGRVIR